MENDRYLYATSATPNYISKVVPKLRVRADRLNTSKWFSHNDLFEIFPMKGFYLDTNSGEIILDLTTLEEPPPAYLSTPDSLTEIDEADVLSLLMNEGDHKEEMPNAE